MVTVHPPARERTCATLNNYADNPYCLELIRFFGAHPGHFFPVLAIYHALSDNDERFHIDQALTRLVDNGLVRTYIEISTPLYGLNDVEPLRQAAMDMAGMEWHQWQSVLRQSYSGRQPG